jgi:hypothetical protein
LPSLENSPLTRQPSGKSNACSPRRSNKNYRLAMPRTAQTKNGHEPKVCERCGLPFEWRKKWERDWANVKYCSEKCKRA